MGGKGSGRKPLPQNKQRVRLVAIIAPETQRKLREESIAKNQAPGRVIDGWAKKETP